MRFLAVLLCLLPGCGPDCITSANIQLTLSPNEAVNVSAITTLRLVLSINGGAPKILDVKPTQELTHKPVTMLLQPDPPPSSQYNVGLTVEGLDALGGLIAIGGTSGDVSAKGCNRLTAPLTPISIGGDGMQLVDLAFPVTADLSVPANADLTVPPGVDLESCAAKPDEDGDGRGDACDLCPADYDPVPTDSDGDGLPDACDPDPDTPENQLLYFDPFNVDSGHWSGSAQQWTVSGSERVVMTMDTGRQLSGNGVDTMPNGVRVQTFVNIAFIEAANPSTATSDVGIFLGNAPDTGSTTDGVLCALTHMPNDPGTLDLDVIQNGAITQTMSTPFDFGTGVVYRLRLTQRSAGVYTCEGATSGLRPAEVTLTTPSPAPPQYMLLRATNVEAHFTSVVAETAQ
jgi:hypothetical protein